MRKFLFMLAAVLILAACKPIVDSEDRTIIKNSLWQDVEIETVARSVSYPASSRDISDSELLAIVTKYNATTLDDFLRVYYGEAPSLEDSPTVDVFIVRPTDYHVNMAQYGIPRSLLVENEEGWRYDARGQLLFIDHVPPPPVIDPPTSMYAWYALYVVDELGAIVFEDHCGYNADESFTGQWITLPESQGGGGWASIDAYFYTIRNAYMSEVSAHPGWMLIEHQLYPPPEPPTP